jgi:hypothetical protein
METKQYRSPERDKSYERGMRTLALAKMGKPTGADPAKSDSMHT